VHHVGAASSTLCHPRVSTASAGKLITAFIFIPFFLKKKVIYKPFPFGYREKKEGIF
jgi:hypothetical protein